MRGTLALAHAIMKRLERGQRYNPAGRAAAAAVAISLVALTTATGRAAPPPISPQTTFFHANALYKDGQYDAAVREYEQLLHAGLESGNLYFNLANAYFKAGEKGRAILNYERALRLQPGDPDVQANLAYAQSLSGAEPCPPPLWQRLVFPLAHRTSTQRLLWATSACYSFLFFGLTAYRLSPQRPRWLVYGGVGLAIVAALAVGSLAHQVIADDAHGQAVVISEGDTPARFEPAENGTVHFVLKEGTRLRVLEQREGWVQVARCDGRRGWVRKASIEGLQIAD
jgi:tetratricopeptide (TPR) repeat protein